jgi:hypothetical protein
MKIINSKIIIGLALLLGIAGLTFASAPAVPPADDFRSPDLPAGCGSLQVPAGNTMNFRVYAIGVQIYRWNGTGWDFVAPEANLYAAKNFRGKVGTHYAGPIWESNSGSQVVAARADGCTPDATAVPWLLLETVSTAGNGIFSKVTYIQRVNTVGGLRPAAPGTNVGDEIGVPYTAEYYFYRGDE